MEKPQKNVLLAPLNWGLGHASRLLPVIKALKLMGCNITVAASSPASDIIRQEFPDIRMLPIRSSTIRYSRKRGLMLKLFFQGPLLLKDMVCERRWIRRYVKTEKPDVIISDNRFGLSHPTVTSCYMTHQVNVIMPSYLKPFQPLLRWLHRRIIQSYDVCLIPDTKEAGLSGKLAHQPGGFSFKHVYMGPLSGFINLDPLPFAHIPDVLMVVSGPEPQRRMLVEKCIDTFKNDSREVWIVAGQPHKHYDSNDKNIRIISHMRRAALKYLMIHTPVVITRSGYTSLMDLSVIRRKAILIPTPGQTEQEYLAGYVQREYDFTVFRQESELNRNEFNPADCGPWHGREEQNLEYLSGLLNHVINKQV
jgi:hypothetical protein